MTHNEKRLAMCARFREERLAKHLSMVDIGRQAGISRQAVHNVEMGAGRPTERVLDAATALGMDTLYIKTGVRRVA